jgi:DNA-binding NarL/FixJ family response regulator
METKFMLDTLPGEDHHAVLGIIDQLAECRTREELNQLLKISLFPLMGCSGAFYVRLQEDKTPKLLDSINPEILCQCRWEDFYEITTQNHLIDNSLAVEKASVLATEAFCCTGKACLKCSTYSTNTFNHDYRNCAFIVLFDSPRPTIALCFFRVTTETQLYNKRDIEVLRLLRATLLQTFNAVIYREECHNLQQILNYLPDHDELLAVVTDDGKLVYKNQVFDQTVGQDKCIKLLTQFTQKTTKEIDSFGYDCYLSQIGNRLYEVTQTTINATSQDNNRLTLLRLSRVTDKKLYLNRKLHKAGLSSRELEVAALIIQGISTHNVSEQLNLSYHTIRNHIKHIYCKLGVSTRSEMLTWGG